jgi:hypothetical protein
MSNAMPFDNPMTPPTSGEMDIDPPRTKWPTVIGVIGIVLSCLGLLCGIAGYFQLPMQRWGAKMQEGTPGATLAEIQVKVAEQFHLLTLALLTFGMILTVWLLVGSIKLTRRRRTARFHLLGWAMASILSLALNVALQYLMFQATVTELTNAGESQFIDQLWIGVAIGGCFGILFGLALQTFTLIWFSRQKVKDEVAQWPA